MKTIFNICVFGLSFFSCAQNIHTVTLMERETPFVLNFEIDTVIFDDAISDTIGVFKNRKKTSPLIFYGGNLNQIVNTWFKQNFRSYTSEKIILRINRIVINERAPLFKAAVSLSFIKIMDGTCYHLKTITKEIYEEQPKTRNKVASPIRGDLISFLFEEILNEFNANYIDEYHWDEINCNDLTQYSETYLHKFTQNNNKDSLLVYYNYADVLTNNPFTKSWGLKRIYIKGTATNVYSSEVKSDYVWGIKLNDSVYKKVGDYFYKINDFGSNEPYILAPKNALNVSLEKSNNIGFTTLIVGGTVSAVLIGMDAVNPVFGILIGVTVGVVTELIVSHIKKNSVELEKQKIDNITGLLLVK